MIEIIDTEPTLWDKIRMIAEYYSKDSQSKKLLEEMVELAVEINFGLFENGGNLPDNTWSEVADVIIMCAQITMQHEKEDKVREWIKYKVDRQLRRMENEKGDDMQELDKILEEIKDELKDIYLDIANNYNISDLQYDGDKVACVASKFRCDAGRRIEKIICKHMNDGWVSVEERLPENAKHKGALCPRYQLMTRYGVTEGWYNPDLESWYILIWFMTEKYLDSEIDFERGTWPKIVRCENKVNDRHSIVVAWRPLPEPYRPETK